MTSTSQIITIIGSTGLIIIGIILVLSLHTPIYGYALIGITILSLFGYVLYKYIKELRNRQIAIQSIRRLDVYDDIFGTTNQPHTIQLERVYV
jgi:hypothetical protein